MDTRRKASSSSSRPTVSTLLVVLGDDLVVGRELAVVQLDGQRDVVGRAGRSAPGERRSRWAPRGPPSTRRISPTPLRGISTPALEHRAPGQLAADLGQPVAVGRDHAGDLAVATRTARRPGAGGSRRWRPRRRSWRTCRAARAESTCGQLGLGHRGQLGVLAVGHAHQLELGPPGLDLGPVLLGALEVHLVAGQALDDLVELAGAEGQAAFALDLGGQGGHHRHAEVGGGAQHAGPCPRVRTRTLARMAMVLLRSAIPEARYRPLSSWFFSIRKSIDYLCVTPSVAEQRRTIMSRSLLSIKIKDLKEKK